MKRIRRKRTRKPGMGARKGSAFERKICKLLSLWLSKGKRADIFWRTSLSGGRATVARKRGDVVSQSGDICAVRKEGHTFTDRFYVECKALKSIDLSGLIKDTGKLIIIWHRACDEAAHYRRVPLLIMKQNGWPVLMVTNREGKNELDLTPILIAPDYNMYIGLLEHVLQGEFK